MPKREKTRVRVESLDNSYRDGDGSLRVTLDGRDGRLGAKRGLLSGVMDIMRGLGWVSAGALPIVCMGFVLSDGRTGELGFALVLGTSALIGFLGYIAFRPLMRRLRTWQNDRGRHPAVTLEIRPDALVLEDGNTLGKEKIAKIRVVASSPIESYDVIATMDGSGEEHMLFASVPLTDIDAVAVALRKGGLEVEE